MRYANMLVLVILFFGLLVPSGQVKPLCGPEYNLTGTTVCGSASGPATPGARLRYKLWRDWRELSYMPGGGAYDRLR